MRGDGQVRGDQHPARKLTARIVLRLREEAAVFRSSPREGPWVAVQALAYGVSPVAITLAIKGRTWAHLPGALPDLDLRQRSSTR